MPEDPEELTSCPTAGVGTVGITGPFALSSFPFPYREEAVVGRCEGGLGAITLLSFDLPAGSAGGRPCLGRLPMR